MDDVGVGRFSVRLDDLFLVRLKKKKVNFWGRVVEMCR